MVTRFIITLLSAAALSACATLESPAPGGAEEEAAALADLLVRTSRADPQRITAARAEMGALRAALNRVDAPSGIEAAPEQAPAERSSLAAAPDLTGARSIMSAVHLASYRNRANAEAGWLELQARFPGDLSGLEPRLASIDLGERGVFLRLKAGPLDSPEAAARLCAQLEASQSWCAPADFSGEGLMQTP